MESDLGDLSIETTWMKVLNLVTLWHGRVLGAWSMRNAYPLTAR